MRLKKKKPRRITVPLVESYAHSGAEMCYVVFLFTIIGVVLFQKISFVSGHKNCKCTYFDPFEILELGQANVYIYTTTPEPSPSFRFCDFSRGSSTYDDTFGCWRGGPANWGEVGSSSGCRYLLL